LKKEAEYLNQLFNSGEINLYIFDYAQCGASDILVNLMKEVPVMGDLDAWQAFIKSEPCNADSHHKDTENDDQAALTEQMAAVSIERTTSNVNNLPCLPGYFFSSLFKIYPRTHANYHFNSPPIGLSCCSCSFNPHNTILYK
jgi:hypothetical protein